jgi:hypothetical protein
MQTAPCSIANEFLKVPLCGTLQSLSQLVLRSAQHICAACAEAASHCMTVDPGSQQSHICTQTLTTADRSQWCRSLQVKTTTSAVPGEFKATKQCANSFLSTHARATQSPSGIGMMTRKQIVLGNCDKFVRQRTGATASQEHSRSDSRGSASPLRARTLLLNVW